MTQEEAEEEAEGAGQAPEASAPQAPPAPKPSRTRHRSKDLDLSAPCPICSHPDRVRIEKCITLNKPVPKIVEFFGIDRLQFFRHRDTCLRPPKPPDPQTKELKPLPTGTTLEACLARLDGIIDRLQTDLDSASQLRRDRNVIAYSKAIASVSADAAKLRGLMPTTNPRRALDAFIDSLGFSSEDDVREIVTTGKQARAMSTQEKQLACERFLTSLYRQDDDALTRALPDLAAMLAPEDPHNVEAQTPR